MKETDSSPSLGNIQLLSWVILVVLTAGSWLIFSFLMARSVLLGGLVANTSFWFLQSDLKKLLKGPLDAVKSRFLIKYYLRLAVLTLVLFLFVSKGFVHIAGLLVGLSTVIVSITTLAVGIYKTSGRNIYPGK